MIGNQTMYDESGGVRKFRRLSSLQTLMPRVVEESEEPLDGIKNHFNFLVEGVTHYPQSFPASSGTKAKHTLAEEEIIKSTHTNGCTITEQTIKSIQTNGVINQTIIPAVISAQLDSTYQSTSQQPSAEILHLSDSAFLPGYSMATPPKLKTTNQLLGIPNYFHASSGMAPDLTEEAKKAEGQSSPDLLRVESLCDKTRATSMPPLSSEDKQEMDDAPSSNIETDSDDCFAPNQTKVFGRFSSIDELSVREQNGEEMESHFVYLTSSLSTQKLTLSKRVSSSQHSRVSAEESLTNEINSILEEIRALVVRDVDNKLNKELRFLEKRLQNIVPLAVKLAGKAETCGAVKQEQKHLSAAESMVGYVEHLKRLNVRESNDHQATRLRLMKAQQEWSIGDMGDNSVNVNITRRSSTVVGGQTQTFGRRRASVALAALPNILGGQGLKQFSMLQKSQSSNSLLLSRLDPKSRFQQLVRKSSLTNALRRTSQDSNCSDYTELPAVTVSRPPDSPANSVPSTPVCSLTPRHSISLSDDLSEKNNNHSSKLVDPSHVAVIKTISAVMPSVETIGKPEKGEVKTAIRRRRSIKRSDTSSSQRNSIDHSTTRYRKPRGPSQLSLLIDKLDERLIEYGFYRLCKERYVEFDKTHRHWRSQLQQAIFIIFVFVCYLQVNVLMCSS